MLHKLSLRSLFAILALLCALLLAYAGYAQFVLHLEPCPLCIFQRFAFIAVLLFSTAAAVHGPGPLGRLIYGSLCVLSSGIGAGIAGWHVWLQSRPVDENIACGAMSLDYMLEFFSFQEAIMRAFRGTGECADIDWLFLGLSMPAWTLVVFVLMTLGGIAALVMDRRRSSD